MRQTAEKAIPDLHPLPDPDLARVLGCSAGDLNYDHGLKRLSLDQLRTCLERETRTSGQAKIRREIRRRLEAGEEKVQPASASAEGGDQLPEHRYLDAYRDEQGRILFVTDDFGDGDGWATCYLMPGERVALHRLESPVLPVRSTRAKAQADLDNWAKWAQGVQRLETVPAEEGDVSAARTTEPEHADLQGFFLEFLPVDQIRIRRNVRRNFEDEKLNELAASIVEVGILEPLVVNRTDDPDVFELIAGERRLRAAKLASLGGVPARVMELTAAQADKVQLLENLQRQDLDAIEEAEGYRRLLDEHSYSQKQLVKELGISQGQVANRLRLLKLPAEAQESISREMLSAAAALALVKVADTPMAGKFVERMVSEKVPAAGAQDWVAQRIGSYGKPLFRSGYSGALFDHEGECIQAKCPNVVKGQAGWYGAPKDAHFCLDPDCWQRRQDAAERQNNSEAVADARAYAEELGVAFAEEAPKREVAERLDWSYGLDWKAECAATQCSHLLLTYWASYRQSGNVPVAAYCRNKECYEAKDAATRELRYAESVSFKEAEARAMAQILEAASADWTSAVRLFVAHQVHHLVRYGFGGDDREALAEELGVKGPAIPKALSQLEGQDFANAMLRLLIGYSGPKNPQLRKMAKKLGIVIPTNQSAPEGEGEE